jgi:hypothetical protein
MTQFDFSIDAIARLAQLDAARALADAGRVVVGMACVPDGADRLPTTTLPEGLTAYGEAPTGAPACPRLSPSLAAFALTAEEPVRRQTLDLFWSLLRSTHGPKLLRLKGLVHLVEHPQGPIVLHAAQQVMHPPVSLPAWPSADRRSRLVLIVRGLDPDIVRKLWAAFLGQA